MVHYLNDTLQDLATIGTDEHSFGDLARHWSEMKGLALTIQFNPDSPVSDADFATIHELLGMAPVVSDADAIADYADALRGARTMFGDAYGFDPANLGDENGENGW